MDTETITAQVTADFAPEGPAVGAARRLVRDALAGWGLESVLDDAVLLVSELVTNAVVHAGTGAQVTCARGEEHVEISVVDRHPSRWLPGPPPEVDVDREGGRGLLLLQQLAPEWGVEYASTSKRVWFRLPVHAARGTTFASPPARDTPPTPPEVHVAAVMLDRAGLVSRWDEAATRLLGRSADETLGRPWTELVLWPEASPGSLSLAEALRLGRWQGTYAVRRPGGGSVPVFASHVATVGPDGAGSVVALLVHESQRRLLTPPATEPGTTGAGSGHDLLVSDAATARLGLDDLLQRTVERMRDGLEGDAAFALLVTDVEDEVELRGTTGLPDSLPRFARLAAEHGVGGRVSSHRMPAIHPDLLQDSARGLPMLATSGMRSAVTVPLLVEDRVIGTLGVASRQAGRFDNDDAVRLQRAADRVALSVQIARLADLDRTRRGWLSFLAEASDLLAGTLDQQMVVALTAQLVVPRLGLWCAIHLAEDGQHARLASVWHADERRIDDLRALLEKAPPPQLRTQAGARPWRPADAQGPGPDDGRAPDLADAAVVTVPLVARGRSLGTLAVGLSPGETFRREVLELAEDLGRRAALAIDNARLYSERTAANRDLQHSLLPAGLPEVPHLDVGVTYQAAGETNEVGGDFYDVFRVADGQWGFAVGDVCGKGPAAAAVTGIARHALRLLGPRGSGIADTLTALNAAILDEGSRARFVTLVHGVAAPSADGTDVTFASAGHPLPLHLHADGTVMPVGTSGSLLGVLQSVDVVPCQVRLSRGDALVFFTDGVTERRNGLRMLGDDGLAELLVSCAGLPAAAVAGRVARAVVDYAPEPPRDDMAVLVLRAV